MKYIEIVRFSDSYPEMDEYQHIDKLVRRKWYRKAIAYMADWDYGGENIDTARAYNRIHDTIAQTLGPTERVVHQNGNYFLCSAHCRSGLYDAYFLVKQVDESELS